MASIVRPAAVYAVLLLVGHAALAACGDSAKDAGFGAQGGGAGASSDGGASGSSGGGAGSGSSGSPGFGDASGGPGGPGGTVDPTTCAEAASSQSYVGCDYWPTPLTNPVWHVFDFAVAVSNPQSAPADVTISGNGVTQHATVAPGQLAKIYLPWNTSLKGPDWDACTDPPTWNQSVLVQGAAYHLVSSVPVTVYQFSALEYQPQGGPSGKDWSTCPGSTQMCTAPGYEGLSGCYSYSNDASLLLPSTAMTGDYRLMGLTSGVLNGGYAAITGIEDGTTVTVTLSKTATVAAGGGIQAAGPGATVSFTLGAGDVFELVTPDATQMEDLSGSLLKASKPVQVIGGHPCRALPDSDQNATCDHLESSVFPVETLGKHYVFSAPTGPNGTPVGQLVRIYGNVDGTTLSYAPSTPGTCPTTIGAGQVVDCGIVSSNFEITGDHEFGMGLFQQSAEYVDPTHPDNPLGDPSMSLAVAVEQYRTRYIFLAPGDYAVDYADVVAAPGTKLLLDGSPVAVSPENVDSSYAVLRIPLQVGATGGAHVIEGSSPFGIQVLGYGYQTSYQYPGGLNLRFIAPPPAQ
ncbi:MAG TPA: IgGFc-binding protein [Polyangiaceae bacterium]